MEKPALIQTLERDHGLKLQRFDGDLEDLMRYRWQNHYAQNAEGEVAGLNLRTNKLTDKIIATLGQATALEALNLSENDLREVVVPEAWAGLRFLDLSENKNLSRLDFRTPHTARLEWLDLNECALEKLEVPSFLFLNKLDVSRNKLTELAFRGVCGALEMLDASDNQLREFALPGLFGALKYLYLNKNQLANLRFRDVLPALEILHLRDNRLDRLPETLINSPRMQALYLHGNPMRVFPEGVISEGEDASSWESVRTYWQSIGQGPAAELVESIGQPVRNDEVKLVLLGNSTSGKSSLLRFLEEGFYDEHLDSTHGILNRIWQPEGKPFKVNVWDFGGQEYYHATHRLFLSNNAVTVVLFEADTNRPGKQWTRIKVYEKGELVPKDLELRHFHYAYWLDNLAYFCRGEKPACLLAQTKMDLPDTQAVSVSEKDKRDYGLPEDTPRISVKGAFEKKKPFEGRFDEFQETLTGLLEQNLGNYELNPRWPEIKTRLRELAREKPAIPHESYVEICENFHPGIGQKEPGANISMLDVLTNILRSTGAILYYPDIKPLAQTVFIDPEAVSKAIYKVLDYNVIQSEGRFFASQAEVVADRFDPAEMLALMCEFQLIFEVRGTPGEFVAPQYLPDDKPSGKAFLKFEADCRFPVFWLRFPRYMPPSVISGFICEYGRLSQDDYWKNGILFRTDDGCDVLAESDGNSMIWVKSSRENPEEAALWFQTFRKIVRNHPDLEVSVSGEDFVSLPVLIAHPAINPIILSTTGGELNYADFKALLDGGHGEMDDKKFQSQKNKLQPLKKKVFVSYAHRDDREYYQKFLDNIRPHTHRHWEIFTDEDIELGEDWEKRLEKEAARCDFAILLVSPHFFTSEFIREKEFGEFVRRKQESNFRFFSLLLRNCLFDQWPELVQTQMFRPLGRDYGFETGRYAEEPLAFAMLVDKADSHREHLNNYCLDFFHRVEKALKNAEP